MKRWVPVLGVVALLAVVWLAATLSSPQVTQLPIPDVSVRSESPPPTGGSALPLPPSTEDGPMPVWVLVILAVLGGLLVLFVLGIVVLLLWSLVRSGALS